MFPLEVPEGKIFPRPQTSTERGISSFHIPCLFLSSFTSPAWFQYLFQNWGGNQTENVSRFLLKKKNPGHKSSGNVGGNGAKQPCWRFVYSFYPLTFFYLLDPKQQARWGYIEEHQAGDQWSVLNGGTFKFLSKRDFHLIPFYARFSTWVIGSVLTEVVNFALQCKLQSCPNMSPEHARTNIWL